MENSSPTQPLTRREVFNCAVFSCALGVSSYLIFPHMRILGAVLGIGTLIAGCGTVLSSFELRTANQSRIREPLPPRP